MIPCRFVKEQLTIYNIRLQYQTVQNPITFTIGFNFYFFYNHFNFMVLDKIYLNFRVLDSFM
jgi:hypothetical protein